MDNMIAIFLSWQFVIFSLGISATMFVFRTITEHTISYWKNIQKSKFWKEVFFPIMPIVIGCIGAIKLPTYPYPENITTIDGQIVFGLVSGFFSGLVYRIVKSLVSQKIPSSIISEEEK